VNHVVSRDEELASLCAFIDHAGTGSAALVLEGEAGIGKSTLWSAGVEHGLSAGWRVLTARPAEAERGLAHVGLGDLFEAVLDDVLPTLPPPRRRALEIALLREDVVGARVDPRALGMAIRTALQVLAEEKPLLLAIDDVQWFDASSADALAFAWRRLDSDRVTLLLARRVDDAAQLSTLERGIGAESVDLLRVGPLSPGALHQLLRDRFDRAYARQTLLRIHETSGGNPFFALELARVLNVDVDPVQSVPGNLEQLVRARITGLPPATRDALGLAAALGTTSEALLEQAGVAAETLDAAVAAHVIERSQGTIRFTHPLLSSVLYADLGPERRAVHARIADVVVEPLLRARHLALSRDAPDEDVAGVLDDAAGLAADRGAVGVGAELAEQALRLTPGDRPDERHRRALAAARAHHTAGEWTRARTIATDLLAEADGSPVRAEALVLLAELETVNGGVALLEEALREAGLRPALQADIHCRLAWATRFGPRIGHARAALELAEALDDDGLRSRARAVQAILGWFAGDEEAPADLPSRVRDFAPGVGGHQLVQEGTLAVANTLAPAATREAARTLFTEEHAVWHQLDEPRAARALWGLAWVEFWAGRWTLAATHADSAHDISIQYGLEVPQDHLPIAITALHRGELELARAHSERALELAQNQFVLNPPQHMAILGLAALWSGDAIEAEEWLGRAGRRAVELGWGEPSLRWWTSDQVELLLERGEVEEATQLIDAWETDATRVRREWVLAHVVRCRGLVAAARGAVGDAETLLNRAVAHHAVVGDPYGGARALLALGNLRRRLRQKRSSREAIGAALSWFDELGAVTWSARAREALGSIGGRTTQAGLTSSERRVAVLVAEGRTNREVATALFLGERTVASHLTHIYAKLGIRSRTELARRLR
jgi:DNA-binding CsgD family transcriptional regulator/tetratricopeptide (TPR) repeat protein